MQIGVWSLLQLAWCFSYSATVNPDGIGELLASPGSTVRVESLESPPGSTVRAENDDEVIPPVLRRQAAMMRLPVDDEPVLYEDAEVDLAQTSLAMLNGTTTHYMKGASPFFGVVSDRILQELGTGAFGVVSLRESKCSPEKVAWKIQGYKSKTKLTEFEILTHMTKTNDPHILQLVDYEPKTLDELRHKKELILLTGVATGGDAFPRSDGQPDGSDPLFEQDLRSAKILAPQVLYSIFHALRNMHKEGFVHLDVKPENILYDGSRTACAQGQERCRILLADFGLAVQMDGFETLGSDGSPIAYCDANCGRGTPGYCAPEMITTKGAARPTPAMDLWSLGVTVWALYFGLPAFVPTNGKEPTQSLLKNIGKLAKLQKRWVRSYFSGGRPSMWKSYKAYHIVRPSFSPDPDLIPILDSLLDPNPETRGMQSLKSGEIDIGELIDAWFAKKGLAEHPPPDAADFPCFSYCRDVVHADQCYHPRVFATSEGDASIEELVREKLKYPRDVPDTYGSVTRARCLDEVGEYKPPNCFNTVALVKVGDKLQMGESPGLSIQIVMKGGNLLKLDQGIDYRVHKSFRVELVENTEDQTSTTLKTTTELTLEDCKFLEDVPGLGYVDCTIDPVELYEELDDPVEGQFELRFRFWKAYSF